MSDYGIHVNDVGTLITLTVMDGTASALNISSATVKQMWLKKPDNTTLLKSASFVTDGSNGQIKYALESSDVSLAGMYEVQAYVEMASASYHGSRASFQVYPNVR
jgi:hypothetical protein